MYYIIVIQVVILPMLVIFFCFFCCGGNTKTYLININQARRLLRQSKRYQYMNCTVWNYLSTWWYCTFTYRSEAVFIRNALSSTASGQLNIFFYLTGSLLCRKCGHDITYAAVLDNRASKFALRQRNDTILGVQQCLVQLFKNPQGNWYCLLLSVQNCVH